MRKLSPHERRVIVAGFLIWASRRAGLSKPDIAWREEPNEEERDVASYIGLNVGDTMADGKVYTGMKTVGVPRDDEAAACCKPYLAMLDWWNRSDHHWHSQRHGEGLARKAFRRKPVPPDATWACGLVRAAASVEELIFSAAHPSACDAHPDAASFAVLADWLQEHGVPLRYDESMRVFVPIATTSVP